ncbi:Iojap-related protein [Nymphaea thermarum]|nr:Iojap-related protein [Nymphaea thermarum]
MWAVSRVRVPSAQPWAASLTKALFSSASASSSSSLLELEEVERVLRDVKAGDVRVVPVSKRCDWADFMVIASGRSAWHVKNIAQALIYKALIIPVKQKQKGADRLMLPSVEGHESGQWVLFDNFSPLCTSYDPLGGIIVHALDEKARSYYNLESLWTTEMQPRAPNQEDLGKALAKSEYSTGAVETGNHVKIEPIKWEYITKFGGKRFPMYIRKKQTAKTESGRRNIKYNAEKNKREGKDGAAQSPSRRRTAALQPNGKLDIPLHNTSHRIWRREGVPEDSVVALLPNAAPS